MYSLAVVVLDSTLIQFLFLVHKYFSEEQNSMVTIPRITLVPQNLGAKQHYMKPLAICFVDLWRMWFSGMKMLLPFSC